jgi:hypothetical protein
MSIDWGRFRLPAGLIGDKTIGPDQCPPRHKARETFIRGPIPWAWISRASSLPGPGFAVAMGAWYLARRFRRDPRASVAELAAWLGMGRTSVKAGLRLAEGAGLLTARREPGHKLVLGVVSPAGAETGPGPLRGPVPWAWWPAASRLGGTPLRVGAACWTVAGWRRRPRFGVWTNAWGEWGLSRFAVARGLRRLDDAGLIALQVRRGALPMVCILEAPDRKPEPSGLPGESMR